MTDELVAWLREQVDEDESKAQLVHGRFGNQVVADLPEYVDEETTLHRKVVVFDPARVLAEVAAKRRIIDLHHSLGPSAGTEDKVVCDACGPEEDISFRVETYGRGWPCTTLRLLASVYAGRPGWRSEWAPDEEENR